MRITRWISGGVWYRYKPVRRLESMKDPQWSRELIDSYYWELEKVEKYPDRDPFFTTVIKILICVILVAGLGMMTGCYSGKKAMKDMVKAHWNYPDTTAKFCYKVYPTFQSATDTQWITSGFKEVPGPTEYIVINCDSYLLAEPTIKKVKIPCPPAKCPTDTVYSLRKEIHVDSARVMVLKGEIKGLQSKYYELLGVSNIFKWTAIIEGIAILLFLLAKWFSK